MDILRYNGGAVNSEREQGFSRRGEPIEVRMERSLVRIRAEMPEQTAHVLITEPWFLTLPVLGAVAEGKLPEWWMPRYHPITGAIYTTRWGEPSMEVTPEGKKKVLRAGEFEILRQPEYRKNINLAALPKSWTIARLIPQKVWGGIEMAMRQQDEIRDASRAGTGTDQIQVEELFAAMRGLSRKYVRGEVTKENLQDLAEQTQALLKREGVLSAKDQFLQDLKEALTLVFQEDSIGRIINPLVARMRLYRAMRDLTKREVKTWLSRRKSNKVFNLLYVEREDERSSLADVQEAVVEVGKHPVLSDTIFRSRPDSIFDEDITEIRRVLKGIGQTLQSVRVAPYLLPAKLADVMLRSNQFRKKWEEQRLRKILEVGGVGGEMERPSVEDLIMQRNAFEAAKRLRHAYSLLDSALTDPDNLVFTL